MNFTKIRHVLEKETNLEWSEQDEKGTAHNHAIQSKEAPDVALVDAFKAFVPLVCEACELPEEWEQGVFVTTLSLNVEQSKGKAARRGVVVTFRYKPEAFNAAMVLNTPHLREAQTEEEEGNAGFIPKSWEEPIAALEEAATKFIQGARSQQEMPLFAGTAK